MCTLVPAVVFPSPPADRTSIAVAVNASTRNTAVAIGAQVAFAIIAGAELVGAFPVESAYTWAFAMGAVGAGLLLLASASMPRSSYTAGSRSSAVVSSGG